MKKKIEVGTAIFLIIVTAIIACLITYMYLTSKMPSLVTKENFYDRITEVNKTIEQRYIGEVNEDTAMDSLLTGYVSAVDKYSTYLDEEEYSRYQSQMNGKYSGVGISVKYVSQSGLIKVVKVNINSPAENAGIKTGDLITKIGEQAVVDISYNEAMNMLRAENGTVIDLVVLRGEEELSKSVTVGEYSFSSVEHKLLEGDIGYVSISEFDNNTFDDFKRAMEDLESKGAAQYVFDVRNNTGGSLSAVVSTLDFLLPEGTLVTLKDNSGKEDVYSSDAEKFDKKFVVLINGSTYSGGELFAAAVRDFGAGKLIGETTYGKGYAQEIIPLSKGALYLSTKTYCPPNGENYEGVGVSPDTEVKMSPELEDRFYELDYKEDTQLVAALAELGKTLAA